MKNSKLITALESELENLYHNATLSGKLSCESDFECDLVQDLINQECLDAIADLKYTYPEILKYGEVYQWGRGGRTVAPQNLIKQKGGSSFSIRKIEDLDLSAIELRRLYKTLIKFNRLVSEFCSSITDSTIEFVRESYAEELETNRTKKRQHFSGVRYV